MASNLGTVFVELSLDEKVYKQKLSETLTSGQATAKGVETAFKALGVKTEASFDAQRRAAENAYTLIKNSATATAQDIIRAEEVKTAKIKALNEQQYGHQMTVMEGLKKNWLIATAAITAGIMAASKAMQYIDQGAKALQVESSFKIMAEASGVSADEMIANMKRATRGAIDESDMMQKAIKLMLQGYDSEQIERFSTNVVTASRYMGVSVSEAYEQVADAIANKMPKALVRSGAITREQMKIVTAAVEAGADSTALYELAMANLEVKALKLAGTQDEATIALQRFHAQVKDTTETIGKGLIWALQKAYGVVQWLAAGVLTAAGAFPWLLAQMATFQAWVKEKLGGTKEEVANIRKSAAETMQIAQDLFGAAGELTKKAADNFSGTVDAEQKASKSSIDAAQKKADALLASMKAWAENKKAAEQAAKEAERLMKQWLQTKVTLEGKLEKDGLTDFEQKLVDIQNETDKLIEKFKSIPGAVALIKKAGIADTDNAVTEQARKDFDEMLKIEKDIEAAQIRRTKIQDKFYESADPYGQKAHDAKMAQIAEEAEAFKQAHVDQVDILKWVKNETLKYESQIQIEKLKNVQQGMASAADAFEALSQLYAEDSRERKVLHDISMAFNVAEKAALTGQAIMAAVAAIATQGEGDPYTAFVRVAAMAAAMAGLLASVGVAFSGGSATGGTAAQHPAMGNSTVLGAAYGAQSESLQNSLDLLSETYDMEDLKLTKIYNELKSLNSNITGLVSSILRTGGLTDFSYLNGETNSTLFTSSTPGMTIGRLGAFDFSQFSQYFALNVQQATMNGIQLGLNNLFLSFGDPLSALFGGKLLGNLGNTLFGGSTETFVGQQGLMINGGGLMNGVNVQQYADYLTKKNGGMFGSDEITYGTITNPVDEEVTRMFGLVFKNLGDTLISLATGLGTDVNEVLNYTFATLKIDLMGKTGEEITKAISEALSNVGDEAAKALFGDIITKYQKVNEGLLETAVRLVTDKAIVEQMLSLTNQGFSGTTVELIKLSESLITVAGGLEKLNDAFQTYYDAFFNDAEKQRDLQRQLAEALGQYGFNLPGTRSGYRALVESLDLTTEAGQAAYVALMQMSKGADEYYDYLEKAKANIKESDYSTRAEYLRAVRGFADGGISTGPESGYEAKLHGTELIISPKKGYGATVKGGDNVILIEEVRKLRAEMAEANFSIASNAKKTADVLKKMDEIGLPSARTLNTGGW